MTDVGCDEVTVAELPGCVIGVSLCGLIDIERRFTDGLEGAHLEALA